MRMLMRMTRRKKKVEEEGRTRRRGIRRKIEKEKKTDL